MANIRRELNLDSRSVTFPTLIRFPFLDPEEDNGFRPEE